MSSSRALGKLMMTISYSGVGPVAGKTLAARTIAMAAFWAQPKSRTLFSSSIPISMGKLSNGLELTLTNRKKSAFVDSTSWAVAVRPLIGGARCFSTKVPYRDSVGRTLNPLDGKKASMNPWRIFRTWYTLYRLRSQTPGVTFRDSDFLAKVEKMYSEIATAIANGEKRRLSQHLTEKMQSKIKRLLPVKDKKSAHDQSDKVVVRTSGAKIIQARIVHMTEPQGFSWVQITVDVTVASSPPHVKRLVLDRGLHLQEDGVWRISEIS